MKKIIIPLMLLVAMPLSVAVYADSNQSDSNANKTIPMNVVNKPKVDTKNLTSSDLTGSDFMTSEHVKLDIQKLNEPKQKPKLPKVPDLPDPPSVIETLPAKSEVIIINPKSGQSKSKTMVVK